MEFFLWKVVEGDIDLILVLGYVDCVKRINYVNSYMNMILVRCLCVDSSLLMDNVVMKSVRIDILILRRIRLTVRGMQEDSVNMDLSVDIDTLKKRRVLGISLDSVLRDQIVSLDIQNMNYLKIIQSKIRGNLGGFVGLVINQDIGTLNVLKIRWMWMILLILVVLHIIIVEDLEWVGMVVVLVNHANEGI